MRQGCSNYSNFHIFRTVLEQLIAYQQIVVNSKSRFLFDISYAAICLIRVGTLQFTDF